MFFPIDFQWGAFASFFANYVATVTRFGKKNNSRSFSDEPHVLTRRILWEHNLVCLLEAEPLLGMRQNNV